MRVLWVCPFLPWPLDSGGRIRTHHLLRTSAAHAEVHLLAVREPGQGAEEEAAAAEVCASVRAFDRARPGAVRRVARAKLERWFHSPGLERALADALADGGWDLVHLDELLLARAVPAGAAPPALQHHSKIDTVLVERTRAGDGPTRHFDLWKLRRLEAYAARRYRHHLVCGEGDRDVLLSRYPQLDVDVLPSGYDPAAFAPSEDPSAREPGLMVYVGHMGYEPNVEAAVRFVRDALPAIRAAHPGARLALVGRDPAPEVRALAGDAVEITGRVDDVGPWLARAALCVVPLAIGGGTRLKIVEALGAGCPVLSTTIGAEGLGLVDGEELALADGDAAFARRAAALLADPAAAAALADRGRARVERDYAWEGLGEKLVARWRDVVARATTPAQSPR